MSAYLNELENESLYILREAIAESNHPVILYSMGKDSSVLLHLFKKAFYPAEPNIPLMHIDTRFKFKDMYEWRDQIAKKHNLIIFTNPEAIEKNVNPFTLSSSVYTDIVKTQALKKAIDQYQFDLILGGARRDEEKSRSKEKIFSFREKKHLWNPENQRPEFFNLFNTRKKTDETFRVFPLSNWTELDIWQYIEKEKIDVCPLYFSKKRPVVIRDEKYLMVDDERLPINKNEKIEHLNIRFRTLGCYPLTAGVLSQATTVSDIIYELKNNKYSERQGRLIDSDVAYSMEKKKTEGYF